MYSSLRTEQKVRVAATTVLLMFVAQLPVYMVLWLAGVRHWWLGFPVGVWAGLMAPRWTERVYGIDRP